MSIYDKPTHALMRQMVTDMPITAGLVVTKEAVLNWFAAHYPKIKEGTVSAHLIRMSTNAPGRVHYSAKPGDDDVFYQIDGGHFRLYDRTNDPPPITQSGTVPPSLPSEDEEDPSTTEFAYERDLRNFLSKNLHILEAGLQIYREEEITGVEFPVGGRFVDILAIDAKGAYVVIELKVSRGYDRAVGQLRRYMGWIAKNQANPGQAVRGIIVAREISQDLLLACYGLTDVELFEYEMSVSVRRIES